MIQPNTHAPRAPTGPSLYQIGCLGRLSQFAETNDGRFLITLSGVARFRVTDELPIRRGYRRVSADFAPFVRDLEPPHEGNGLRRTGIPRRPETLFQGCTASMPIGTPSRRCRTPCWSPRSPCSAHSTTQKSRRCSRRPRKRTGQPTCWHCYAWRSTRADPQRPTQLTGVLLVDRPCAARPTPAGNPGVAPLPKGR